MSQMCFLCNLFHVEMIRIFRHPKKLDYILRFLLGLQAKEDDYLCKGCCDEVIKAFDCRQKSNPSDFEDEREVNFGSQTETANFSRSEVKVEPKSDDELEENKKLIERLETGENAGNVASCSTFVLKENIKIESVDTDLEQIDAILQEEVIKEVSSTLKHAKKESFVCPHCGMSFSTSLNFKRHIRVHMTEKPYVCSECGRNFIYLHHLERHRKTHTGERPYACPFCGCGKSITTSSKLKEHKKIHPGERNFACFYCSNTFKNRSRHWEHVRKKHTKEINLVDSKGNFLQFDPQKPKVLINDGTVIKDEIGLVDQTETDISIHKSEVKFDLENDDKLEWDFEVFTGDAEAKDVKYHSYMLTDNSELRVKFETSNNVVVKCEAPRIAATTSTKRTIGNRKGRKETTTQRKRRLMKEKRKREEKLARESSEQRQIRLEQRRLYNQQYRARQSLEQREARLEALRQNNSKASRDGEDFKLLMRKPLKDENEKSYISQVKIELKSELEDCNSGC